MKRLNPDPKPPSRSGNSFSLLILLTASLLLNSAGVSAQPVDSTRTAMQWSPNMTGSLTLTQVGFRNWKEGGSNSFSFASGVNGKTVGTSDLWRQTHDWRLSFGQLRQDTLGFRKSEDMIRYAFALQYRGSGPLNPTAALELRTQFAEGYDYKKNPFKDGRALPVLVSDFFAPATITQSIGITYDHSDHVKTRLGVAARETVVIVPEVRSLYNVEPYENYRIELGVDLKMDFEHEIMENVNYKSALGLFAAFNRADLPDALWENFIEMRVNRWIAVKFDYVTRYKRVQTRSPQMKSVLAVGLSHQFL